MLYAHGQLAPMDPSLDLLQTSAQRVKTYRVAIGSHMFLMEGTRLDMSYGIVTPAKHVERPSVLQWVGFNRVMCYMIRTNDLGILYGNTGSMTSPILYVDADWAGDPNNRK